jgi:hypothetical protein
MGFSHASGDPTDDDVAIDMLRETQAILLMLCLGYN